MGPGSGHGQQPGPRRLRASDRDRDDAVAVLRRVTSEGYLTLLEFEERLDAAFAARYLDELDGLVADIPGPRRASAPRSAHGPAAQRAPRSVWWPAGLPRLVLRSALGVLAVLLAVAVIANLWIPLLIFGFVWCRRNRGRCGFDGRRHRFEYI